MRRDPELWKEDYAGSWRCSIMDSWRTNSLFTNRLRFAGIICVLVM